MLTFAFDADKETPESVKRRREMILAMQPLFGRAQNVGEGIGQALTGLGMGIGKWQANKAEKAGMAGGADRWAGIMSALSGGGGIGGGSGGFPDASAPVAPMDPASARVSSAHGSAIRDGLVQRGLPPHVAEAFVMNFQDESGLNPGINEANPIVPGSRGGFGLSQWTGPRRKALESFAAQRGVPVSDTDMQLDFLMTELQGPEKAAFQKIMAAQDTGSAAAAIVNNFLRPAEQHRAAREARYRRVGGQQVASLGYNGPGATIAPQDIEAMKARAPTDGSPYSGPGATFTMSDVQKLSAERQAREQAEMDAQTPPWMLDMIRGGQQAGSPQMPSPQEQIAQAMIAPNNPGNIGMPGPDGGLVPAQGAFPPPPPAPPQAGQPQQMAQAGGLDLNTLMQAAGDPWLPDAAKPILKLLIEQEMQKNDPMRQLQMQNMQSEIANRERSFGMDQQKFGFDQQKFANEAQLAREKFEWEKGKPTDDIREYDFYANHERQAGREPLGPLDWEVARRKAGATSITNTVGGETLTPGQKKIDEAFADTYLSWQAGGFADSTKQLSQLQESLAILESGENITGAIGTLPDFVQPFINEQGTIAKEQVEEVVQRNLREILGAQFTEKEGERLISRAFNPRLKPAENAKRVRRLIGQISSMAASKQAMVDYFDENGTLRGYTGPRPSMNDLNKLDMGSDPPIVIDGYTIEEIQ